MTTNLQSVAADAQKSGDSNKANELNQLAASFNTESQADRLAGYWRGVRISTASM